MDALTPRMERFTKAVAFCSQCEDLILAAANSEFLFRKKLHHTKLEAFEEAAASGCTICSTIYRVWKKREPELFEKDTWPGLACYFTQVHLKVKIAFTRRWSDSGDAKFTFQFLPLQEYGSRSMQMAASYDYPPNTGGPTTANLVRAWLDECVEQHRRCYTSPNCYSPPRLLDLAGETPLLRTRSTVSELREPYATLSHCWGTNPSFLTLTATNIDDMTNGIRMHALPRTFQDVILLCKRLKIRYIWIDSLCIIQSGEGSADDWLYHLIEMRQIYRHGLLNIAASHASSPDEGLYMERDPNHIRPVIFTSPSTWRHPGEPFILLFEEIELFGYQECPLSKRGWVFQERLLSPRILHFGHGQVFWECSQSCLKCESYPAGISNFVDYLFRPPQAFDLPSEADFNDPENAVSRVFSLLIRKYTGRQLTYPDIDKFAAFSGIVEHFNFYLKDEYVAGVFQRYLPEALLWRPVDRPPSTSPRTSYRCPSWSWAKIDSAVEAFHQIYIGVGKRSLLASVADIELELVDPAFPYGRLKNARLKLRGRLIRFRWHMRMMSGVNIWRAWLEHQIPPQPLSALDAWLQGDIITDITHEPRLEFRINDIWFDGVAESRTNQANSFFLPIYVGDPSGPIIGLILNRIGEGNLDKYERIGRANIWDVDITSRGWEELEQRDIDLV